MTHDLAQQVWSDTLPEHWDRADNSITVTRTNEHDTIYHALKVNVSDD